MFCVFSEIHERHLFSRIFRPEFVKYNLGKPGEHCWAQLGNIFFVALYFC